jgi:hypothetical protein
MKLPLLCGSAALPLVALCGSAALPLVALCGSAALSLVAGCASQQPVGNHWTSRSVQPSIARAFLSYDVENDGPYREFQWRKKQDINLTLRRHLFNHNPYNPFQQDAPELFEPRPPHSLLPRPWNYIHLEGLVFGAISYASGGIFLPLPIDSIIGTLEEGGDEEFFEGVGEATRPIGVLTESFLYDALPFPDNREKSRTSD